MANQAAVVLDFIVIGGSSAGLSAAYALRRVGHRVTVLEQNPDFLDVRFFPLVDFPPADFFFFFSLRLGAPVWRIQDSAQHVQGVLPLGLARSPPQVLHQVDNDMLQSL